MVITLDQNTTIQHGGLTLTGSSPSTSSMKWWFNNEATIRTNGFTRTGPRWQLDIVLPDNCFIVNIMAEEGTSTSNVLTYQFETKVELPEVSFQFNEFDELGSLTGLTRIPGETNSNLRRRILDTHITPGNSSKIGLVHSIERDLDLPHLLPFFFLSARWDPRQSATYHTIHVGFETSRAVVQFNHWIVKDELLDIDTVTFEGKTKKSIGGELASTNTPVTVTNAGRLVPHRAIILKDDNTIVIDTNVFTPDLSKQVLISYPYKETLEYYYYDTIENIKKQRTVLEVKEWMQNLQSVEDEYLQTVPSIVWNDGYLEEINFVPTSFSVRETTEDSINRPPTGTYVQITETNPTQYLRYFNEFPSKGFFKASQIYSFGHFTLTKNPLALSGTWPILNYLSDKNFQERLKPEETNKNLEYYAKILRKEVRMGVRNSVINYDYWGSDAPKNIGPNFVPATRDSGLVKHPILTDEGNTQLLTLNQRRYYAKKLAILYR